MGEKSLSTLTGYEGKSQGLLGCATTRGIVSQLPQQEASCLVLPCGKKHGAMHAFQSVKIATGNISLQEHPMFSESDASSVQPFVNQEH